MLRIGLILGAVVLLAPLDNASAQTRCEPTLANPCKPQPSTTAPNAAATPPQRREPMRLNESPFQDIQVDRNTSIGLGHGGIIGLERKYDPKEQPWR
jgi:hypothetical protein